MDPDNAQLQHELQLDSARDAEADSELAEILKELPAASDNLGLDEADTPREALPTDVEEQLAAAAEDKAPEAPEEPAAPAAPAAKDQDPAAAETRATLRLMEREAQVREREAAVEKREAQMAQRISELEARLSRVPDEADLRRRLLSSPVKFLESLNIPPEQVGRLIIAEKLGADAPPELRDMAEKAALRLELEEMREEMARERVRSGVREHSTRLKGDSKYPTLAKVAESDPGKVADAILARLPRGRAPEPADIERATADVEKDWSFFASVFSAAPATTTAPPASDATTDPSGTKPQATTNAAAMTKPPAKPSKAPVPPRKARPWGADEDYEELARAAVLEATAIVKRATQAR